MSSQTRNFKKCAICNRRRTPGSNVFLSRIPLEPDRCRKWVKSIGEEDLVYLPIEKLNQLFFVCEKHFKNEDFNKSKTRLLKGSVPTINLNRNMLHDELFQDFPLHIGQYPKENLTHRILQSLATSQTAASGCQDNKKIDYGKNLSERISQQSATPQTVTSGCQDNKKLVNIENLSPSISQPSAIHLSSTSGCQDNKNSDYIDNTLRDVTNLSFSAVSHAEPLTRANRRKFVSIDTSTVPETSGDMIEVKSYKRIRRSAENKDLNTREQKLLQKLKTARVTLRSLSKTSLDLEKLNNEALKNLVGDAVKNHRKSSKGRRWNLKTKLWALAIFKRSPKAYKYLEWAMPVPSVRTLQRLLQRLPLEPGINMKLIAKLKTSILALSEQDKYCALLFDEMALKKRLFYNEGSNKIEGFEDLGEDQRTSKIADHALVFMIQGLRKKIKQPIAYYFVQGTISSEKLYKIIKDIISVLDEAGLKILCTVCDQGPTNVGALSLLKKFGGQSTDDNFFVSNEGNKIYIMFDIPHLFKSIRNNFFNAGEIVYEGKIGKWCHLVRAEEKNRNFLNFPKLTKNVVNPTYKIKMRVKYAAHALSNTTSAVLKMLAWNKENDYQEINKTANIIQELDKLFDVCNGPSSPKDVKKGIRENVSSKTNHVEMWRQFEKKVSTIQFRKSDSKMQLKHVRCITGFKTSLKSLNDIWHYLKKEGFKFLNLRQLNQDSLENLFGVIRQHSPTNKNPTCTLFTAALKTSIISGLTSPHSRGSNCEVDENKLFFDYHNELDEKTEVSEVTVANSQAHNLVATIESENLPVLSLPEHLYNLESDLCAFEDQPVVYVSGFLAYKLTRETDCITCINSLKIENPENNALYTYISLKEWWKDQRSLTYPTNNLCNTVANAKIIFENNVLEHIHKAMIRDVCAMEFLAFCDLTWLSCKEHDIMTKLLKLLSELFIRKYCKTKNNEFVNNETSIADSFKKAQQQSKA